MIARLARTTHVVSAFWVLVLAAIIFVDVMGRYLFSQPLLGATEIIANSVVSITFLQLPLAIHQGGMIRSTLLYDAVGERTQRVLRTLACALGLAFFIGTAFSAWEPALEALAVSEYEGEGALRVPTYPVRFLVVATSIFAAWVYVHLLYVDWTGRSGPGRGSRPGKGLESGQGPKVARGPEPEKSPKTGQEPGSRQESGCGQESGTRRKPESSRPAP